MTTNSLLFNRYILRIYGLPRVEDEEHDRERAAIESGRAHVKGPGSHFAELRDLVNAKVVWTGYITQTGAMQENYEREPGSDDA